MGRSDDVQQNITVQPGTPFRSPPESASLRFASRILTHEHVEGWVSLNGQPLGPVTSAEPTEYNVRWASLEAHVEVTLSSRAPEGTYWELDFRMSGVFAAGSLKIDRGVAVVLEPGRVVFRLRGVVGEKAGVSFRKR